MAIDMIEDNELSALAPMRNGGHFKDEISSSIRRKKPVMLNNFKKKQDTYANFTIFGKEVELSHTSKEDTQYATAKRFMPIDDKSTCETLQSYVNSLETQIEVARKKAITNSTAGERADAQDEANGKSKYKLEILEKMKSMKCDIDNKEAEQKKNTEQALLISKSILEQNQTKSNILTYAIIGGVIIIGAVTFILIKNRK
jgi:hypothetical protein